MNRDIVYPGEVPLAADFLNIQRNTMVALAYDVQAWGGTGTIADGLTCIPDSPASLVVQVTPGSLCSIEAVDQTSFGSLASDTAHQIMQQGILLDTVSLTLVPPSTSGDAQNYLIQAQFQSIDADPTVLSYFNSTDPRVPWMGPANSGTAQFTTRQGRVAVQAKAGVAATAGTQVTPNPDAGWAGLYAVTVAQGATALNSTTIALLKTAPFIAVKLPQVPAYVQGGSYAYTEDTSATVNHITAALDPVPASYQKMSFFVKNSSITNTGAMTANINGLGNVAIVDADAAPLVSGVMAGGYLAHLVFDGTSLRFMNSPSTTAIGSVSGSSGEGITVSGTTPYPISLNAPGLTINNSPGNTDLFPYWNQTDVHHRDMTWAGIITGVGAALTSGLLRITPISVSGTWTRGANTRHVLVFATGGGGGGGGGAMSTNDRAGYGGAGGGTAIKFMDVTAIATVAVTIGAGGAPSSGSDGGNGGNTSFGTYAIATGGQGGLGSLSLLSGAFITPVGGAGSAGDALLTGQGGGGLSVGVEGSTILAGGVGGDSFWGGGGYGVRNIESGSTVSGGAGVKGGGGGGGSKGSVAGSGGAGGNGFVLILEFS